MSSFSLEKKKREHLKPSPSCHLEKKKKRRPGCLQGKRDVEKRRTILGRDLLELKHLFLLKSSSKEKRTFHGLMKKPGEEEEDEKTRLHKKNKKTDAEKKEKKKKKDLLFEGRQIRDAKVTT